MIDFISWGSPIIYNYGLIGVFLIALISASTVMIMVPGWVLIVLAGHIYPPFLVGLVAAVGYTIGETTAYFLGRGGNYIIEKKKLASLDKVKKWFKKHGFVMLPIFAAIPPMPMDLLGLVAGTLKYDLKRFMLGTFIGELAKCMAYAYIGFYGIKILGF